MAQVNFHVRSNRISQMEVDTPHTVAEIREMLAQAGFDVRDSHVTIIRKDNTALIGHTDGYVPGNTDIVRFDTSTVHLPLAERAYREVGKACCANYHQPDAAVRVGGHVLSVEAGDDGKTIVIRFR